MVTTVMLLQLSNSTKQAVKHCIVHAPGQPLQVGKLNQHIALDITAKLRLACSALQ